MTWLSKSGQRATPVDHQIVTAGANASVGKLEAYRARKVASDVSKSFEARKEAVDNDKRIDRNFAIPAGGWDMNTGQFMKGYLMMARKDMSIWKNLRLYTQYFTGNSLLRMNVTNCEGLPESIPVDYHVRWPSEHLKAISHHWRVAVDPRWCELRFAPPNKLGEVGWWLDGVLVNVDTIDYQERLNFMALGGVLRRFVGKRPRILEIGGGFGALCRSLCAYLDPSQYIICDLPESLIFSGPYLAMTQRRPVRVVSPKRGVDPYKRNEICLLPNYLAEPQLKGQKIDLVINTLSMSEMSAHQVDTYARLISAAIGSGGVFFEQNHDDTPIGWLDCRDHLRPHFKHHRQIATPAGMPCTRGTANLWTN